MSVQAILELKAKPDCVEKTRVWFREVLPDTRAFEGFVTLHMIQNQDDPTELLVIEQWDSRAAYEKYVAWRQERGDLNALAELVAAEPVVRVFDYFGV